MLLSLQKVARESRRLENINKIGDPMISRDAGRKLIFDNVDHRAPVHTMTEQHQNEDEHWVAVMATENRITDEAYSDKKPRDEEILTMENGKCLPNASDHKSQIQNYVALVGRIMTKYIPCLKFLEDVSVAHIRHRYSTESMKPTETVSTAL